MNAANDNLPGLVSGTGEWESLHDAAKKVVEACARERASLHQSAGREDRGKTDRDNGGGHQASRLSGSTLTTGGRP